MEPNSTNLIEGRTLVQLIIFAWLLLNMFLIGCWDGWCFFRGRYEDTVSDVFIAWNRQLPLLAVCVGFLICHLIGLGAAKSSHNGDITSTSQHK